MATRRRDLHGLQVLADRAQGNRGIREAHGKRRLQGDCVARFAWCSPEQGRFGQALGHEQPHGPLEPLNRPISSFVVQSPRDGVPVLVWPQLADRGKPGVGRGDELRGMPGSSCLGDLGDGRGVASANTGISRSCATGDGRLDAGAGTCGDKLALQLGDGA